MTIAATAPKAIFGLHQIAPAYRAVLCDIWGVVHNGEVAFTPAVEALSRFRSSGGVAVLITNAPRPAFLVRQQLDRIGVDRDGYDAVVTSGDVTASLLAAHAGRRVHHLGPDRDLPLYQGLAIRLCDLDSSEIVSCTGLVDDERETPEDYDGTLRDMIARDLPMVCANPDLVVERGDRLIHCAGALAERYRRLGGRVTIVGKPYPPIYDSAMERIAAAAGARLPAAAVLAIGDGVSTDMLGANQAGMDALFVTSGIHAREYEPGDPADVAAFLERCGAFAKATLPRLSW